MSHLQPWSSQNKQIWMTNTEKHKTRKSEQRSPKGLVWFLFFFCRLLLICSDVLKQAWETSKGGWLWTRKCPYSGWWQKLAINVLRQWQCYISLQHCCGIFVLFLLQHCLIFLSLHSLHHLWQSSCFLSSVCFWKEFKIVTISHLPSSHNCYIIIVSFIFTYFHCTSLWRHFFFLVTFYSWNKLFFLYFLSYPTRIFFSVLYNITDGIEKQISVTSFYLGPFSSLFRCSQRNRCERADEPYRFAASLNQCVKATVYPDSIAVSEPSIHVSLHTNKQALAHTYA